MKPSFKDFALLPSLQATLKEKALTIPTEIQQKALPAILAGKSIVGVAETGSGKTLSYVLPILDLIKRQENDGDKVSKESLPRGLVIVPTRELGEQVSKVFKVFTHGTRLRVRTILGGTKLQVAKENVKGQFEILVATPGRLLQMIQRRQVALTDVRLLVLDEADQMIDPGFLADAKKIMAAGPENVQIALFSATVSPEVQALMNELVPSAKVFRTAGASRVVPQLKTENKTVQNGKRFPLLQNLIANDSEGGTLIFTNTREQCDRLAAELNKKGVKCAIYRGEMDKIERRANLKAFRDGDVKLLISTDLASRGLDVEHVGRVINYHMPQHLENYLHRVGRTARAGREGIVINFVTERDQEIMNQVQRVSTRN
ncbi:MAG: DEAD/DEAH box helicase [Bdellovibrionales bacterium]|nr:DEAD/DEAH box helicase [Bdellovibrionales bacterium]